MVKWPVTLIVLFLIPATSTADIDAVRRSELVRLLRHDCGSCHGLTLRGGLGPALLPKNLAGRGHAQLSRIILDGIPGTPMPPWRPMLSEEEARWLARILIEGVPDEP